jgi:hypothetical protein
MSADSIGMLSIARSRCISTLAAIGVRSMRAISGSTLSPAAAAASVAQAESSGSGAIVAIFSARRA